MARIHTYQLTPESPTPFVNPMLLSMAAPLRPRVAPAEATGAEGNAAAASNGDAEAAVVPRSTGGDASSAPAP
jgi:hypothetical protein